MNSIVKAHIALFLVALIYGANYTIAKEVLDNDHIQPIGFILLRIATGLTVFWLIHGLWIKEKMQRSDLGLFVLCGLLGVAINQTFFFSGLKLTKPINASLIMTTTPILVLIASSILIKERITVHKVIGILLGAAGAIYLISNKQAVNFSSGQILGDLMIFINASSFGIYLVLAKSLMRKYHPITVVKWVFLFGFCFVFPFGIREVFEIEWTGFTLPIWLAFFYVLLFTTVLAYFLNTYALKAVNPTIVGIYIYLQPVLATLIALFMARDILDYVKVISAAFIFTGVFLVSYRPQSEKNGINVTD